MSDETKTPNEAGQLPQDGGMEQAVSEAYAASEDLTRTEAVQKWDEGLTKVQDNLEAKADALGTAGVVLPSQHHDELSDTVNIFGRTITVPGGIYTVVFGVLGALTLLEVLLAEILTDGAAKVLSLVSIAMAKSALVILFYMHLRSENRLLWAVLLLPLAITLLSILYLIAVPSQGYTL